MVDWFGQRQMKADFERVCVARTPRQSGWRWVVCVALLCGLYPASAFSQQQGQLAVYQGDQALSNGATVDIGFTDQNSVYQPSMPPLGLVYVQKGGPCGVISWSLKIAYDGNHFRSYDRKTKTYGPPPADYDQTNSPTITGQATCKQQVTPIDWTQLGNHFYGGTLTISWNGTDGGSGTITLTVDGINPDNAFVDSYLGTIANPIMFPVQWFEKMITVESAADQISPTHQYHQFRGHSNPSTGSGTPNDHCGCPEGVGLGQIDNNTDVGTVKNPAPIGNPDLFWNWSANLGEAGNRLKSGLGVGAREWNNDENKAIQRGLSFPDAYPATANPPGCSILSPADYANAYGMAAYNGGRFLNVVLQKSTNTYAWAFTANRYVQHVCAANAY